MTNWAENFIWLGWVIIILGMLMIESVFGPPLVSLWIFSWLMAELKLGVRFWLTLIIMIFVLAIIYVLSFSLACLLVVGLALLAQLFLRQTKLWSVIGIILSSGIIFWFNQLNLRYYGWWLLLICIVGMVWWLIKSSFNRPVTQLGRWAKRFNNQS